MALIKKNGKKSRLFTRFIHRLKYFSNEKKAIWIHSANCQSKGKVDAQTSKRCLSKINLLLLLLASKLKLGKEQTELNFRKFNNALEKDLSMLVLKIIFIFPPQKQHIFLDITHLL